MIRRNAALLSICAMAGCAAPDFPGSGGPDARGPDIDTPPPAITSVRHLASTEPYSGGRLHLFVFSPDAARPLDDRIRAARAAIDADPDCDWIEAPRDVIISETQKQGAAYGDTMLVAPLRCT